MSPNTFRASSLKISPLLPKVSLLNSIPLNFLCVLFPARPLAETSHVPLQLLSFLLNHASIIVSHLPLSHCVLVFAPHESAKLISQVGYLGRLMVLSTFYLCLPPSAIKPCGIFLYNWQHRFVHISIATNA